MMANLRARGQMGLDDVFNPLTPAQQVMAEEMSLAKVLDAEVGPASVETIDVQNMAYEIINGHELVLSLKQWQVVQTMLEQGIRAGYRQGLRD